MSEGSEAPEVSTGAAAAASAVRPPSSERERLRKILDMPVMGFLPWILLSVVEGPNRVVLASALALALAVVIGAAGVYAGAKPKLLDLSAIAFFAALAVVAAVGDSSTRSWLGDWAGEVSNITIALIALGSILVRRPFTLEYAREQTKPEEWEEPLFLRINYVISAVWCLAFVVTAAVGYIGDGPLHQPDNVWTNWIVQIALLILAGKFTEWYPEYATAAALGKPSREQESRSVAQLLQPVVAYLVPAGIVVMIVTNNDWWIGGVVMVIGIVVSRRLREIVAAEADGA